MVLALAVLLHLVFPAVDIGTTVGPSRGALDAGLWVVDLLLVLGQVGRVIKCLCAVWADMFFCFQVDTIHVTVQSVLDCKRPAAPRP